MSKNVKELSASGVKKYKDCPKSFWYKYLSDIEPPEKEEPEHFKVGNAVHDSLENFLLRDNPILSDNESIFEELQKEEDYLDYDYDDNDKVDNCFQTASRWISSFINEVHHVEEEWEMNRDGIRYRGMSDLVAEMVMDGTVFDEVIVDWKTGSENSEWKEKIQGGMYLEMYYDKFGSYPDAVVFVYLDEETQSMHSRIDGGEVFWNEQENKYWTKIQKYKSKIINSDNSGEWEANPDQSRCYFCDYKHHCIDSGIGAEEVTKEHIEFGGL